MTLATWKPASPAARTSANRTIARLLRSKDADLASVSERIERGLAFRVFAELGAKLGVTQSEFAGLLRISESTLYRRKAAGRFEPDESDRLWRYLHLYARAVEAHEQAAAAVEWLRAPLPSLGGRSPLVVARDDAGAQRALAVLGRIEHGVFG